MSASPKTAEPSVAGRRATIEVWILWAAAAVALAYLVLQRPYAGDVALKTSMCVLLAIAALRSKLRLFALALLFSAAGDAFLAYDGQRLFVRGLASFLATHVLYAVVFVLATRGAAAPMSAGRKVTFAVIPTFAVAYSVVLWPNLGALAIPVVLYIAAIVVMAMLSLRVRAIEAPLGAVLFMVSDSLISLEKFLWQAAWIGPLVWITYALAQLLITRGMLTSARN
ncbi:MAG TPA: lysoplasmalogenase [Steroidobacteraceae bacterium]